MSDEFCECVPCRYANEFSDDPEVDVAVRALIRSFNENPFSRVPHQDKTISGIRRAIAHGWGKAAARHIRITVH
jgi:hypothetical protein